VARGKVDAHCGLFFSRQRARRLAFSDALLRMRVLLFARNDVAARTIGELEAPVGVVRGDYAVTFLSQRHSATRQRTYRSYRDLQDAVVQKRSPAFVYDYPMKLPGLRPMAPPDGYRIVQELYAERLRAGVRRDNLELLEQLNFGLARINDRELFAIADRYEFYRVDHTPLVVGIVVGAVLLLGLAGAGFQIRRLRGRLRRATRGETTDWAALIREGESDRVEFKSSLRWDYRQQKVNKALERVIAKTLSAFLNSDGGRLLIGVDDGGRPLGLQPDYDSFSKKQSADGFLLALSALINNAIGKKFHRFISVTMASVEGEELCVLEVRPADQPAFLLGGNKEEFYIRAQASSQPLGLRDAHEYISSRWPPR
jgi:hypothetical protein